MSYRIENNEIIIEGWEKGISPNPFEGISDMRAVDPITVPGEVSVAPSTVNTYTNIPVTGAAFTVDPATDIFTWAGSQTLTVNTVVRFTNSGGALPTGLSATKAYYIISVPSSTTFTVSEVSAGGALKNITGAGSGTNTFTVVNMGRINFMERRFNGTYVLYFAMDENGRAWIYNDSTTFSGTNTWVYMNNLVDESAVESPGPIIFWRNTLLVFKSGGGNYKQGFSTLAAATTHNWGYSWITGVTTTVGPGPAVIIAQNDYVYVCNGSSIASLNEVEGSTFDPTNAATYTWTPAALDLLATEQAQCLNELGSNLIIGGVGNNVYLWDKISPGYDTPLFLSENYTHNIVTVNTTSYLFVGSRGRIYVTNGSNVSLFWKIPDYITKTTIPQLLFTGATFYKNKLYFAIETRDRSGNSITGLTGLWAIDLDSGAFWMETQTSQGNYNGYIDQICQNSSYYYTPFIDKNQGNGIWIAWYNGSIAGIDKGISTPYTNGQSYVTSDAIPVGKFLEKRTFQQMEFNLSAPLVAGESVTLSYSTDINATPVDVPITQGGGVGDLSGIGNVNFENVQVIKATAYLTSTATNPSYVRLKNIRIR